MCGFVRVRISLVIVRSNTLLIQMTEDKKVRIWKQPEILYGAVMVLLVPWRG